MYHCLLYLGSLRLCVLSYVVSNIVRFVSGLAFISSAVAAIVWAVVIHAELTDGFFDVQLNYSWGVLIPAAFFNICTGFATQ